MLAWIIKKKTDARLYWFLLGAATFFVSQCILRLPWQIPLAMWVGKRVAGHAVLQVLVRGRPGRGLAFALLGHFLLDFAGAGGAILLAKRTGSSLAAELAPLPSLLIAILVIRALRPANISSQ